jgi:hypothetical protein
MEPNWLSPLLEGAIPFVTGACLTQFAFVKRGRSGTPGDTRRTRLADQMKLLGPMLMVIGVALAVRARSRPQVVLSPTSQAWDRFSTADSVISAEFPETPRRQTKLSGSVETKELKVSFPDLAHYTLFEVGLKTPPSILDRELILDQIRTGAEKYWAARSLKAAVLSEQQVTIDGFPVQELDFSVGESYLLRIRIIILRDTFYQAVALTRRGTQQDLESKRFLESIRIDSPEK